MRYRGGPVEVGAFEVERCRFFVGDGDACGVYAGVESCANWVVLLSVHRRGDCGSPRAVGSTKLSKACSNFGSASVCFLRPAPDRRSPLSTGASGFSSRTISSANPLRMVFGDIPITPPTARTPPQPYERDSAAAHCLRMRSSINTLSERDLDRRARAAGPAHGHRLDAHADEHPCPSRRGRLRLRRTAGSAVARAVAAVAPRRLPWRSWTPSCAPGCVRTRRWASRLLPRARGR